MIIDKKNVSRTQEYNNETTYSGLYGNYYITNEDKKEVKLYRLSLLLCALGFSLGLIHWIFIGPSFAWIWLIIMAIGLGGSLNWIHIYLKPLHQSLQIFWLLGCLGILIMMFHFGPNSLLNALSTNKNWTLLIGPLFAALTGLGFKEFFCFRRPEAIGLTILTPIALLGHISYFFNNEVVMVFLIISSILLLILSIRKFGIDPAQDIGDKSIFDYLDKNKNPNFIGD